MAYRPGSSLTASPEEIARRNGISPALATSREARAAGTGLPPAAQPVITPGRPERFGAAALKGAVKVGAFPARSLYPFREIADDGGVWKLDPAAFTWHGKPVKVTGLRSSASKWATENGFKVKTVIDDGFLYVQFTRGAAS